MEEEKRGQCHADDQVDNEEYSVAPTSDFLQACAKENAHQKEGNISNDDDPCGETCCKDAGLNEVIQIPRSMKKQKSIDDPPLKSMPGVEFFV